MVERMGNGEEAEDFWYFCYQQGHEFTEEPLLAFVAQKQCRNPGAHTIAATDFLWASDWKGRYAGRLPDGVVLRGLQERGTVGRQSGHRPRHAQQASDGERNSSHWGASRPLWSGCG